MPTVTVYPKAPEPSHDISLQSDSQTIGLLYARGPQFLQEIPISEPSRPFTVTQKSWHGGKGRLRYQDDPTGFYDNQNIWNMSEGRLISGPLVRFANGIRSANTYLPDGTRGLTWQALLGTSLYVSNSFSASATYNADKTFLWVRRVGIPGSITVNIHSDTAGSPGTVLKTITVTPASFGSVLDTCMPAKYFPFDWTGTQSLTSATTYHVSVSGTSADNENNHWEVGTYSAGATSKQSSNGSSWSSAAYSLFYRVTDASIKRKWFFFYDEFAMYAVSSNDDGTGSSCYINGDRFKPTSATSTTLTDTGSGVGGAGSWTANMWTGARVIAYEGPGKGASQPISSNTTTALTTSTWDEVPTTNSKCVIYSTDYFRQMTSTGLGRVISKPAVAVEKTYFPQGGDVNMRRMSVDYTQTNYHKWAADGTNKASRLAVMSDTGGTKLWKVVTRTNKVASAVVPETWTDCTFGTGKVLGSLDYDVTNLFVSDGLYATKEDSMWKFQNDIPYRMRMNFEQLIDKQNGNGATTVNGAIWMSWGDSVVRVIGSDVQDMMNYRQGFLGMPPERAGNITDILSVLGWTFVAISGGTNQYSTIMAWNGMGWVELFRGWDTTVKINSLFWQSCPDARPRLWFDIDGDMAYIEFPFKHSAPLLDTGFIYAPESVLITSIMDANQAAAYKLFHSFKVIAQDLGTTGKVYLDWQKNKEIDTNTWHNAGVMTNLDVKEFILNIGECHTIRFRLRIQTTAPTTPVVIYSTELNGWISSPLKYQWVGSYSVGMNQKTRNGLDDFGPDFVVDFLKDAFEKNKKIYMRSLKNTNDGKFVTLSAPVIITDTQTDEGWSGRVQVAIREA